jgi:PKD repeat protein
MRKQVNVIAIRVVVAIAALLIYTPSLYAQGAYGTTVDNECFAFNGTQPYADYQLTPEGSDDKCTFCHQPKPAPKADRKDPEWTWWQNQYQLPSPLTNFCPPQTNQAPESTLTAPANNSSFTINSTVNFTGTGNDPDNNLPLSYSWNFGGAATNSIEQNPTVTLNTAGTFTVTFTVTDELGRMDPTPASITITVIDPNANQPPNGTITSPAGNQSISIGETISFTGSGNDPDNNTPLAYAWNFGGGATVPDPNLPILSATFSKAGIYTVSFTVTDSKGLSDPAPATRIVSVGTNTAYCSDQDNDKFSPDGDICGPIDCNDFDASINPGAIEACGDQIDNDCNGNIDGNDIHCQGGDCVAQLFNQVDIAKAKWDQEDSELKVTGYWETIGDEVKLSDALTGKLLATTTVQLDEEHESHPNFEWEFELEHLTVVPCRVRVEINGRYGERDVAYAPMDCSGKPPVTNNSPVANNDNVSTTEGVAIEIAVLNNDTDADQDRLTITLFTQPEHGVVTRQDTILTYTPNPGFSGSDDFAYTISDRHGGTDNAKVTITVKTAPHPINVTIDKAQWNRKNRKLLIRGSDAPKDASVSILNASTGVIIGTTKTEDNGRWKDKIEKPAVVPCKIRVVITKGTQSGSAEKAVSRAPRNCQ